MSKIMIISGSLGKPSHTLATSLFIEKKLQSIGCDVTLWNLEKNPLPLASPEYHSNPIENPDVIVNEFVRKAIEADSFIWCSPLYHNSYSGVLKNALDHLSFNECKDKPIGLISNGGGMRNVQALDHMRIVARGLLGLAIPIQVATCKEDFITIKTGELQLINKAIIARINNFIRQLIFYTKIREYMFSTK